MIFSQMKIGLFKSFFVLNRYKNLSSFPRFTTHRDFCVLDLSICVVYVYGRNENESTGKEKIA